MSDDAKEKDEARTGADQKRAYALPKIDFSTFVLSLTSSAFYHLGDIADPQSGEKRK